MVTRYQTGGGTQSRFGTDLERFRNFISKRYSGHLGRVQTRVFVIWKRWKYKNHGITSACVCRTALRVRLVHEHLTKRINELDVAENNLLDLVEAGGAVAAKVRDRLMAIGEERGRVKSELAEQGPLLEAGAAVIEAALGPAGRPAGAIPPNE
jgi:hypothetical protein